ncbi:MAG: hypothetical protein J6T09_06060, partial [Bacteroidales bacterium]|nr:hypothetical protein [Bacteroidales bacterium]
RFFCSYLAAAALLFCLSTNICRAKMQDEPQNEPNWDEVVAKQVNELIDRYKLDDYQAFKVDTLLQHYIPIYNEELRRVRSAGASQIQSYQRVVDIWGDFFDTEYQKIFTEEQWKLYMKSFAGKEKRKRDKRLAEARGETAE